MMWYHYPIKKAWAWAQLVVLLFATTPHQLLHDVIQKHKDTVDVEHHDTRISKVHAHCVFLQEILPPYKPEFAVDHSALPIRFFSIAFAPSSFHFEQYFFHYDLRGPPFSA